QISMSVDGAARREPSRKRCIISAAVPNGHFAGRFLSVVDLERAPSSAFVLARLAFAKTVTTKSRKFTLGGLQPHVTSAKIWRLGSRSKATASGPLPFIQYLRLNFAIARGRTTCITDPESQDKPSVELDCYFLRPLWQSVVTIV